MSSYLFLEPPGTITARDDEYCKFLTERDVVTEQLSAPVPPPPANMRTAQISSTDWRKVAIWMLETLAPDLNREEIGSVTNAAWVYDKFRSIRAGESGSGKQKGKS